MKSNRYLNQHQLIPAKPNSNIADAGFEQIVQRCGNGLPNVNGPLVERATTAGSLNL